MLLKGQVREDLLAACCRAMDTAAKRAIDSHIANISQAIGAKAEQGFKASTVPIPAFFQLGRPCQAAGEVLLDPGMTLRDGGLGAYRAEEILPSAWSDVAPAPVEFISSDYGRLLLAVDTAPPGPQDVNIAITENVAWTAIPGRPVPGDFQMTVLAAAQEYVWDYGNIPAGEAQDFAWKVRMHRLAHEVRWEIANGALLGPRTDTYVRERRIAAERGYELELDPLHGRVLAAGAWRRSSKRSLVIAGWTSRVNSVAAACFRLISAGPPADSSVIEHDQLQQIFRSLFEFRVLSPNLAAR
jgi:hypothetical protein